MIHYVLGRSPDGVQVCEVGADYSRACHSIRRQLVLLTGVDSARTVITRYSDLPSLYSALLGEAVPVTPGVGARDLRGETGVVDLLTVAQTAERLGVTDPTVRARITRGELTAAVGTVTSGGHVREQTFLFASEVSAPVLAT